jgi:hypothetical protein
MTPIELCGMACSAVIGSLIAQKFKTREKCAAWFESLNLDYPTGIGLGVVLMLALFVAVIHLGGRYQRNPFVFW